ncbi:hypothetical protein IK110_01075 [Candidatus Saccharibacteria bacterium]|nr:hypothetical protein [Candidatus Saccharibacteria bacterium]
MEQGNNLSNNKSDEQSPDPLIVEMQKMNQNLSIAASAIDSLRRIAIFVLFLLILGTLTIIIASVALSKALRIF